MRKKAIILAAGMGTRLKPLTLNYHKCLTEIHGTPILLNALQKLEKYGVEQVTLVVGYLKEQIYEKIGLSFGKMQVVYAENDAFEQTNTAWSLKLGLEQTQGYDELYLLEGDVFFEQSILERFQSEHAPNATILEAWNPNLDGTFVELGKDGYVIEWTHKSRRPQGYTVKDKLKTVNIHRFCWDFVQNRLIQNLQSTLDLSPHTASFEMVMERLVRAEPRQVKGIVLQGEKWFEIDDAKDLQKAELLFS